MFLELSQLQVHYPGQSEPAVAQVSLGLEPGQIGALIGPSGCGKTTVLRAVAGLEPISSGNIDLAGRRVSAPGHLDAPESRRIGMVFQDYALFPHLSIQDNIAFGLHRWPQDEQVARINEVLGWVGLSDSGKKFPHELSGGQQQRVALARALAPRPDVLLLDEPFSNLDVDLRERLAFEVRELLKAAKTTALFVTHDQAEAFAMGDRVGVMHQGRLHQWASPYELYHAPASRFVASFIGQGVLLPAQRRAGLPAAIQTELGLLGSETAQTSSAEQLDRSDCEVLIRADDVVVTDPSAKHQALLEHKAFRGAQFLYTLRLPSGTRLYALVPSHQDHAIGTMVGFNLQLDHLITFSTP
jgi:iron(III) transport system ATP-binding protein